MKRRSNLLLLLLILVFSVGAHRAYAFKTAGAAGSDEQDAQTRDTVEYTTGDLVKIAISAGKTLSSLYSIGSGVYDAIFNPVMLEFPGILSLFLTDPLSPNVGLAVNTLMGLATGLPNAMALINALGPHKSRPARSWRLVSAGVDVLYAGALAGYGIWTMAQPGGFLGIVFLPMAATLGFSAAMNLRPYSFE